MSKARDLADFISDSTVETAELADNAVTSAKLDETDSYTVAGLTATTADINGGTIDGVTIGGASAGAGTFTGLTVGDGHTIGDDASDNLEIASGSGENIILDSSAGNILFKNNGSDTARINSNDKVLIGTTAEIPVNNNSMKFQIAGTTFDAAAISLARFVNSNGNPSINFGKTRSGTIGTVGTIVNDDDALGSIAFCGDDGVDIASRAAQIAANVDGTPGSNDMPGRLVFATTSDGASSATERMRITQEGHVLINKQVTTFNTAGIALRAEDVLQVTRNNATPVEINRTGNDGKLIELYKDGSSVGSIGTASSYLTIGSGVTGLLFDDIADKSIRPWNLDSNTSSDADTDLGISTQRFKDLYLSGGVYLGGTGAANKLDDYEEGTWIPVYESESGTPSISYIHNVGFYTRIGNIVHVQFSIRTNSFSVGTASGAIYVGDLPFVVESTGNSGRSGGSVGYSANFSTNNPSILRAQNGNDQLAPFYRTSANGAAISLTVSDMASGAANNFLIGSCTYQI